MILGSGQGSRKGPGHTAMGNWRRSNKELSIDHKASITMAILELGSIEFVILPEGRSSGKGGSSTYFGEVVNQVAEK